MRIDKKNKINIFIADNTHHVQKPLIIKISVYVNQRTKRDPPAVIANKLILSNLESLNVLIKEIIVRRE